MNRLLMTIGALVVLTSLCRADKVIYDFDGDELPPFEASGLALEQVPSPTGAGKAIKIAATEGRWSSVRFEADGFWDWTGYTGLAVDITNPGAESLRFFLAASNPDGEGERRWRAPGNMTWGPVPPGETTMVALRFNTGGEGALWGMQRYPVVDGFPTGPARGSVLDLTKITAVTLGISRAEPGAEVLVDNIRLWGGPDSPPQDILPFVDRYGQYALLDWPRKVKTDEDLAAQLEAEREQLDKDGPVPGRDEYGGWAEGPQLEATGWFRAEQVDGKWWLVTPTGHLFFSAGIDCVISNQSTFVDQREAYFEWLPESDGAFKECYDFDPEPLNNAGPLQETGGRTFSFYRANLVRKYGENWHDKWMEMTFDRMRSWGFNTVAGWSEHEVYRAAPEAYAVCVWSSGEERPIAGARGYWSKMPDVHDPSFEKEANRVMAEAGAKYADDPRCIGYFFQNEMSWGRGDRFNVASGTLSSPPDQPCRQVFVGKLQEKYGTLEAINAAWETEAPSWDELRAPRDPNDACKEDLREFTYAYALQYFRTVHEAMQKHTPNQLDMGCRFSSWNDQALKACAEVVDVVSFNIYQTSIEPERWSHLADLGKPCIIGEFHSGSLDRGALHRGVVPVNNQAERAETFIKYVNSVVDMPVFVGCHWFQYTDEPVTGRSLDGENWNVGLVTVTDTPFVELVDAARQALEGIYERRYHGPAE